MSSAPAAHARDAALAAWVGAHAQRFDLDAASLAPASADASFRRYFRVRGGPRGTLIVMDAPPGLEKLEPFLYARDVLARCDVRVPEIALADVEHGFVLLEDFGSTSYLDALDARTAPTLYDEAIETLVRLHARAPRDAFGPYGAERQRRDLELFRDWYCVRHLAAALSADDHATLDRTFALLIAHNTAQTQVATHWDYHARNLMVLTDRTHGPGVIDFQDAVIGPITYDLVSLMRDAYIAWDESFVIDIVARFWDRARRAQLAVPTDFADFWRDFEWMGLHRHLRVLGIFARLNHRDGKAGYLNDMPQVLAYVRACAARYAAFAPLLALLDTLDGITPDMRAANVRHTF